jgi:hypothetical protein
MHKATSIWYVISGTIVWAGILCAAWLFDDGAHFRTLALVCGGLRDWHVGYVRSRACLQMEMMPDLPIRSDPATSQFDPKWTYDSVSALEREGYRLVRTRISTNAPTATAYFSMVVNVGRVHTPLSRRETTLFVVHILTATSSCVIPAAVRAATRSATSICNVRSDLNVRARRILLPRSSGSDARFLART